MGTSALVSTLPPGCVAPGCAESQARTFATVHRSSAITWAPPAGTVKGRIRVSVSAFPSSSSSSPSSSSPQCEPDSRAGDGKSEASSSKEASGSDAGAGSETSSLDALLPSRKQGVSEGEAKAEAKGNAAQSAMERAMAYKKQKGLKPSLTPAPSPEPPSNPAEVEILAGKPIQSSGAQAPSNSNPISKQPQVGESQLGRGNSEAGSAGAFSAFERAKAYKQQQSEMIAALRETQRSPPAVENENEEEESMVEIEIHTRDGVVRRKVTKPETAFANVKDIRRKGVSTMDFVGLGFADKKPSSSRPPGLTESFQPPPTGPLPEVEVLTRDGGVADPDAMADVEGDDVYKPRVTTWGVFPRPANISKAYGGGRTIMPGEQLETEKERKAREAKTKKLLDEYKKKLGLDMAPEDRARCERTLKEGEKLMDRGQLRDAQAAFLTVTNETPFASELYGMAALQEAVCIDSLNRSDEAKLKYEKLTSHPNGAVRKKARQLLFGFQAAEKLKVRAGYNWDGSSYRKYFDGFADGYDTMYKRSEESADKEDSLMQTLLYALLLIFPVILVFTLVALRNA